ncbi:hypothetical protein FA95DRAFT_992767 [Auriscalpium vulgare]|uniref:Uncharacterized protein n=1 Tax=Auriscalpium vulgare TaxID=40419 RepID=A0ACB8R6E9_9AGAM|nr:hypothetical protein FA95DRAFT_992767 [Auriscalpium vulgare]
MPADDLVPPLISRPAAVFYLIAPGLKQAHRGADSSFWLFSAHEKKLAAFLVAFLKHIAAFTYSNTTSVREILGRGARAGCSPPHSTTPSPPCSVPRQATTLVDASHHVVARLLCVHLVTLPSPLCDCSGQAAHACGLQSGHGCYRRPETSCIGLDSSPGSVSASGIVLRCRSKTLGADPSSLEGLLALRVCYRTPPVMSNDQCE